MDCGEQALLPAIRQANPDTLIVADGFSCQTQIADAATGRRALHTAQVMTMAAGRGGATAHDLAAAAEHDRRPRPPLPQRLARTGIPALTAAAGLAALALSRVAARHGCRRRSVVNRRLRELAAADEPGLFQHCSLPDQPGARAEGHLPVRPDEVRRSRGLNGCGPGSEQR